MLEEGIYKLLDEKVSPNFFPETGMVDNICFKNSNEYDSRYFPCHTRDDNWLVFFLKSKFDITYISISFLVKYMKVSYAFNKERHDYEQRIVKWQIEDLSNGGKNCIMDNKLGGDLFYITPKCDIAFRKAIVDTLLKVGLDIDSIEEGLEKNANIWRDKYITLALKNAIMFNIDSCMQNDFENNKQLNYIWKIVRLYDYYQTHKDSVDKYGEVLPEMKVSKQKVMELKKVLSILDDKEDTNNSGEFKKTFKY